MVSLPPTALLKLAASKPPPCGRFFRPHFYEGFYTTPLFSSRILSNLMTRRLGPLSEERPYIESTYSLIVNKKKNLALLIKKYLQNHKKNSMKQCTITFYFASNSIQKEKQKETWLNPCRIFKGRRFAHEVMRLEDPLQVIHSLLVLFQHLRHRLQSIHHLLLSWNRSIPCQRRVSWP